MASETNEDTPMSPHEIDDEEEGQIANNNEENTIIINGEQSNSNSNKNDSNILNTIQHDFASLSKKVLELQSQINSLQKENQDLKSKVFGNPNNKNKNNNINNISISPQDENKFDINENKNDTTTFEHELDLVFLMDCTGSMGSYIQKGKESIMNIVEKVKESEKCDVRFSYIAYRDFPPQDRTFITKIHPFTRNTLDMKKYISQYAAKGGGDAPEAVTQALHEASKLEYRENAIKICVIIADAPPHGLGQGSDGFPDGNPNGHDPIVIARKMAKLGIILYVIACEPALSKHKGAHDLMASLAKITEGRYLPLTGAHLLGDVIIGGAKEEISLKKLEDFVENKMKEIKTKTPKISASAMRAQIHRSLSDNGYGYMRNSVTPVYHGYDNTNIHIYSNSESLRSGRRNQIEINQPNPVLTMQHSNSVLSPMDAASTRSICNRINNSSGGSFYD